MILSDVDLINAHATYTLVTPYNASYVQPASIDLTLGNKFIANGTNLELNVACPIAPREFLLGTTVETVNVPPHLVAQINGRSTWARRGLIVHTTAGFIDPGFNGTITLELYNVSENTLYIPLGERICQIVFTELKSPAARPYGSTGLGSHYQGQHGVTPSAQ
jgi:dCTP deaminase